jgi:hypothetical protein
MTYPNGIQTSYTYDDLSGSRACGFARATAITSFTYTLQQLGKPD